MPSKIELLNIKKMELTNYVYRNVELKKWIETNFYTEVERNAAWDTFRWLKDKYPQLLSNAIRIEVCNFFNEMLRGELISEETKEIKNGNN